MTAPSPVLSPSNILPPPSSHWAFIAAITNSARLSENVSSSSFSFFILPFFNFFTLKFRDLKFRNSGSVCTSFVASLPNTGVKSKVKISRDRPRRP